MSYHICWKVGRSQDRREEVTLVRDALQLEARGRGFLFNATIRARELTLENIRYIEARPYSNNPAKMRWATCTNCQKVLGDHDEEARCLFAYKSKWHHADVRYYHYLLFDGWVAFHRCVNDVLDRFAYPAVHVFTDHGGGDKSARVDIRRPDNLRRDVYVSNERMQVSNPRFADFPDLYQKNSQLSGMRP